MKRLPISSAPPGLAQLLPVFRDRAAAWDEKGEYPRANVDDLVAEGLLGMTVPAEYGGQGASLREALFTIELLSAVCGVTGRIAVDNLLGGVGALVFQATGSVGLKKRFSAGLIGGDKPAIQITEPEAGTDVGSLKTSAVHSNGEVVLNGTKTWITVAPDTQAHVVIARDQSGEIVAVYVDGGTPGMDIDRRHQTMGMRGMWEVDVAFRNCRVSEEMVIARGLKSVMSAYNSQRLGAATVALGIAQGSLDLATDYARRRHQFGRPIAEFQGLRWMLVDCDVSIRASRGLIWNAATIGDQNAGVLPPHETAIAKLHAAETAVRVTNVALQVFGARGYSRELPLERHLRDARMFTIGGGTVEALRNLAARRLIDDDVEAEHGFERGDQWIARQEVH